MAVASRLRESKLDIYEIVLQEVANYQLAIVPIHDRFNEHLLIQPAI
ncbi:hypothetical protein [Chamaesiphon sp. VAR_69_metabat_338]|nr:hypothetical protein [Chamaesiphon sp. VAR_69_metabat_338]